MDDLVTWLRAQLDEDEREIAKHPDDPGDPAGYHATEETGYPALPILLIGRRFALAEIEAKRQIIDEHDREHRCPMPVLAGPAGQLWTAAEGPCYTLRLLALPYADRPEYRDEWRP